MAKYLVTGGTGFIGSALVRRLVRDGHHVRVLDNESRHRVPALQDISDSFEMVTGDIRDPQIVDKASKGQDGICHLAYINGTEFFYEKPELVLEVAVKGMVNTLDAAKNNDVPEFFLMSSSEVYQTPETIPTPEEIPLIVPDLKNPRYSYGGGKIICELMAVNYGRKFFERTYIVRPHNVYGPNMGWEHVIPQFAVRMHDIIKAPDKAKEALPFELQGTGKETRAFVFIDDFIDGTVKVMENGENFGVYHIGTMNEVSIARVAEIVASNFNQKIKIITGPEAKGATPRRCPDISKIRALGYEPQITLEEGIRKTVEWYRENIHQRRK